MQQPDDYKLTNGIFAEEEAERDGGGGSYWEKN